MVVIQPKKLANSKTGSLFMVLETAKQSPTSALSLQ
jgi:hypothetical protein